jgi:hypothetical protein
MSNMTVIMLDAQLIVLNIEKLSVEQIYGNSFIA